VNNNYYLFTDQQYGPYDLETLKRLVQENRLNKDSWVFLDGETKEWTRAGEVNSLKALFQPRVSDEAASKLLAERLKQATATAQPDEDFGTMLVAPMSKAASSGVKPIQSVLPSAPLSDIPASSVASEPESEPENVGWFERLKNLFRRKS